MRILILGNNFSAKEFYNFFEKNKDNIVFSTAKNSKNYIEFDNTQDILEFCEANEINLVLITQDEYINQGVQEAISAINVTAFAPSIDAISICSSKSYAKKFMHKNKILTPKFFIAEKPQLALDYYKSAFSAQVIKPDSNSYQECPKICETQKYAQNVINELFANGNKKIIIEDYIEGKNITLHVLSNGYCAKIIGASAKYQNNLALFNPDFLTPALLEKAYQNTILPTITALTSQDEEYIGILSFDFILDRNNDFYLLGIKNFFDDLDVDFYTKDCDIDWANVFDSTIIGDVFQKFDFPINQKNMLTIRQDEKIYFISANTKNNLKRYLKELEFDLDEFNEAEKIWKY